MIIKNIFKKIIIVALVFFSVKNAEAAQIITKPSRGVVHVGEVLTVDISLDNQGQSLNAVSGEISFPDGILKLDKVLNDNSIINAWIVTPHEEKAGSIVWSGVIPGGFNGVSGAYFTGTRPGFLFQLVFHVEKEGYINFNFNNLEAYLNDGIGSQASISAQDFSVESFLNSKGSIATSTNSSVKTNIYIDDPNTSSISAYISRSPLVSNNDWFVAFNDTSGATIVRYEIVESNKSNAGDINNSEWNEAKSPYVLKNQARSGYVYIKATDSNGNEHITAFPPQNNSTFSLIWVIIAIIFVFYMFRVLIKRAKRNHAKVSKF